MKYPVYFPHDANAGNDPKILALRAKYSFYGYGVYWYIVEYLRNQPDYHVPESMVSHLDMIIPKEVVFNNDLAVADIIKLCIDLNLFVIRDGYFFSDSLITRMKEINGKIEDLREAGRRGALKRWGHEPANSQPIASHMAPNSNKRKVNKIKVNKKKHLEFIFLTEEEYSELVIRFGEKSTQDKITTLNNYIGSTGKNYQSHYHTILTWARKDDIGSHTGTTIRKAL